MLRSPVSLFTAAQREQFTLFPQIDERTLSRYYLLDAADLSLVRERRDFNKLGYAVQLTVLRHLGRVLRPGETLPEGPLAYLAEQLRVDPGCYAQYAAREPTRREHFAALCQWLGYSELSRHQGAELRDWLVPLAVITDQPFPLMGGLMDEVRRLRGHASVDAETDAKPSTTPPRQAGTGLRRAAGSPAPA